MNNKSKNNKTIFPLPEELLPQRGNMLLVQEIIHLDAETAISESKVKSSWPFFDDNHIPAIILIEVAAQTAGLSGSWQNRQINDSATSTKGWIVGIKKAVFKKEKIALGTVIRARSEVNFSYEQLREASCLLTADGQKLADITIQLFKQD